MRDSADIERFVELLPKVELHVHLEGAIRPRTLLRLARRHSITLPAATEEELRRFFEFSDFDHFLEVYLLCSACLREPEDFQLIVDDFLAEQARQNVCYTEAYFTISTHIANGVNAGEVADAMRQSIQAGERRHGTQLRLIPDIVRNVPVERADQTLEWALSNRDSLVAALGIAGKESSPCEPFREHFREAERAGLPRVAHAGEQTNADDVWRVLEVCRPQRIGHGIRAVDDPLLIAELKRRGVPLEISQSSNVCLGYAASLDSHPLRQLHDAGVAFSIASDDPALFDTSLNREYRLTARLLELSAAELAELALSAISHAFLGERDRARLERESRRQVDAGADEVASRRPCGEVSLLFESHPDPVECSACRGAARRSRRTTIRGVAGGSKMSDPVIAEKLPAVLELEPGSYWWCRCGRSENQPFCDGSHKGTDFTPMELVIQEKRRVALCRCKHTGNAPYCDGAHARLD